LIYIKHSEKKLVKSKEREKAEVLALDSLVEGLTP
tara:strand:+ start:764 stop:868 length:105 start_codon:yes stop_codon:yes gene_type:complete